MNRNKNTATKNDSVTEIQVNDSALVLTLKTMTQWDGEVYLTLFTLMNRMARQ